MSEITYISEELVMEGNLDSAGSSVVVAGRFKGELRAKDVLLESNSVFDGNLIADKVTLGGPSCLAGDIIGEYKFTDIPKIGERVALLDQAHYTMVKTSYFNGVKLPSSEFTASNGSTIVLDDAAFANDTLECFLTFMN